MRLEDAKLLTVNRDATGLVSLDAHPLLREYFAARLKKQRPGAWRAAHKRLFEHLCATPDQEAPTLADLQPLYQAVAHGCEAGLQQGACDEVYWKRILRGNEFYSTSELGAFGADLGAVACFFETPWSVVSPALTPTDQAWLLSDAAFRLRGLGRLGEAVAPMQAGLKMAVSQRNWVEASRRAINLSELRLTLGEIAAAIAAAKDAVAHAERSDEREYRIIGDTAHADALAQAGRRAEAEALFRGAEALQAEFNPQYPLLYSLWGFRYCNLLLEPAERAAWRRLAVLSPSLDGEARGACGAVSKRVQQMIAIAGRDTWPVDIARGRLTQGRATLYSALLAEQRPDNLAACRAWLREAVDGLRRAGDQIYFPPGLLSRALLRALEADPAGAKEDLDEALDIATRGPMPLFLADVHLHRARLFGLGPLAKEPYPWDKTSPQADLAEARRLIEKHGYGRREEELEDAERALGGG
jgi:tetratricopeptide (TPR) repeat protein